MNEWITIKTLKAKNPDLSNRHIARELGISHNTVKSVLQSSDAPSYDRQEKTNPDIEPFKEIIFEMANVKNYRGSRILNEIKSKGYKGGKTAFYSHLAKIRISEQKHFEPYETAPGEQAQFDWSPYTVLINNILTQIYVYSYINAFSRYQILEVSLSQDQGSVFEALENSMIESGGVCSRVQTDNAKVFVENPSKNNFAWNKRYIAFCAHYGYMPSRSLPKHPWSKGKVEKPFAYLEDHFITGASFENFADLVAKLKSFQQENNNRIHSTTKQAPAAMFEKERASLLSLPPSRYVGVKEETRKVSGDCLFTYDGSRYSVPWMFACKYIWIKISQGYYINIYSAANLLIARHKLSLVKGAVVVDPNHYKNYRAQYSNYDSLKKQFLESFPGQELFLENLKAQKKSGSINHLTQIIAISKLYSKADFLEAIKKCLEYNVFNQPFIAGYLEKNHKQVFTIEPVKANTELPACNVKPDLSQYNMFGK